MEYEQLLRFLRYRSQLWSEKASSSTTSNEKFSWMEVCELLAKDYTMVADLLEKEWKK